MLRKLVESNLRRNRRLYLPYLLSAAVLGSLNYIIWAMLANRSLMKQSAGAMTAVMLNLGQTFVLLLTVAFMLYASSFIAKQREQEMGLYSMLGMTSRDLTRLLALEQLFLAAASWLGSVLLGGIFEKIAFQGYARLLQISGIKESWFSPAAAGKTALLLAGIYLFLLILGSIRLKKMTPKQLWQAGKKPVKIKHRTPYFFGLLGAVLLGSGYYQALTTKPTMTAFTRFMTAVVLVVAGSYLVFISGSIVLLKFLQKRKSYYYRPKHFIAVSGLLQRMQANGAGLASICLMVSAVMVVLFGSISAYSGEKATLANWNPTDVVLIKQSPFTSKDRASIQKIGSEHQARTGQVYDFYSSRPWYGYISGGKFTGKQIISRSSDTTLIMMDQASYEKLSGQKVKLRANEALAISKTKKLPGRLTVLNRNYRIKPVSSYRWSFNPERAIFEPVWVIVKSLPAASGRTYYYAYNYRLRDNQEQKRIKYERALSGISFKIYASSYTTSSSLLTAVMGGLIMAGMMISIALILTTAVIIYFKQITEAYADRQRFITMEQVGLSQKESVQAIHSQVLMIFFFPLLGGIVNLLIAAPAVSAVLSELGVYDRSLLLRVGGLVTLAVFAFYLLIYAITTRVYRRIVNE